MNEYQIGDYGLFEFTILKWKNKREFKTYFELEAEIKEMDMRHVWITDNDDMSYLVERERITKFIKKKKNELSTDKKKDNI